MLADLQRSNLAIDELIIIGRIPKLKMELGQAKFLALFLKIEIISQSISFQQIKSGLMV